MSRPYFALVGGGGGGGLIISVNSDYGDLHLVVYYPFTPYLYGHISH